MVLTILLAAQQESGAADNYGNNLRFKGNGNKILLTIVL